MGRGVPRITRNTALLLAIAIRHVDIPKKYKLVVAKEIAAWISGLAVFGFKPEIFVYRCCGEDVSKEDLQIKELLHDL